MEVPCPFPCARLNDPVVIVCVMRRGIWHAALRRCPAANATRLARLSAPTRVSTNGGRPLVCDLLKYLQRLVLDLRPMSLPHPAAQRLRRGEAFGTANDLLKAREYGRRQ
jgi:hypothetical protein